jgi:hypothetical protein
MAEIELPEKYNWWLNELDSLGISTLEKNGSCLFLLFYSII